MSAFDGIDLAIIRELDSDPRRSVTLLAERLGCARATVQARLRRLESEGHVAPYSSRIRPAAVGRPVQAIVAAQIDRHLLDDAVECLRAVPEIVECFVSSGEDDLFVRIAAVDHDDLYRVTEAIRLAPGILRSRTTVLLRELIPLRLRQLVDYGADRV